MTLFNCGLSLGLASAMLVAGPARVASAGVPVAAAVAAAQDDEALQSKIETGLKKNSVLAPRDIDVEVQRGVVTLEGTVRSADERSRAAKVAKIRGVKRVDNRLEIDPNIDRSRIDRALEKTKEALGKAVDATAAAADKAKDGVVTGIGKAEEGVGTAADAVGKASDKVGDKVSDASVTTQVKARFSGEPLLQDTAIDVDTNDRVVTLRGTVGSNEARVRAGALASGTDGVARVVNDLVVRDR